MKKFFFILFFGLLTAILYSQALPDGYILYFHQNFSVDSAINEFRFSNPRAWKISHIKGNGCLEFSGDTLDRTQYDAPNTIGIIGRQIFGDFVLEADMMKTGNKQENPEMCIFYSLKDSLRYYFVNLASQANDSTHGIFLVKNAAPLNVSDWQSGGINWGNQKWNKIRVERSIVNRTINVFFNDMKKPVITTRNPELVMGYLGFGSQRGSGCIDNIKIWAPTSIPEEASAFEKKIIP